MGHIPKVMLREVRKTDLERLTDILNGVREEKIYLRSEKHATISETQDIYENYLKSLKDHIWLVAEATGEVVGEGRIWRGTGKESHIGYILAIVNPKWRQKGVGNLIIQRSLQLAIPKNLKKICAVVISKNEAALRLLEENGFVEEGRRREQYEFYDGTYADEVFMARWLKRN